MRETAQLQAVRRPRQTERTRMDPIATLPVFFKLEGKRVVIAGGSEAAAWKAELAAAAGAIVDVYAADPCDELQQFADPPSPRSALRHVRGERDSRIVVHRRAWTAADLEGATLAIGAIADEPEAARFAAATRKAGVPCNVVDRPDLCDFQFGAIVNRSPLVIGISTDGAAPMLAQSIRSDIEGLLAAGFRRWVLAARRWRVLIKQRGLAFADRRRFWERFTALARRDANRTPDDGDMEAIVADITCRRSN